MYGDRRKAAADGLRGHDLVLAHGRLQGEAYVLHSAVTQQGARLRENRQPGAEWMADQRLFAEALRGLLRAAEATMLVANDAGRQSISRELAQFKAVAPAAVEIRDALEHFDDYILGVGKRSKVLDEYSHRYSRGQVLRVHVGPMSLDVDSSAKAATDLAAAVLGSSPRADEP